MAEHKINGWSRSEIEMLMRKTGRSRELVERFCSAVDKRLFMALDERKRRATLYFHLGGPGPAEADEAP